MGGRRSRALAAFIVALLTVAWAAPASAGHYDIFDVGEIFPVKQQRSLAKAGITTTLALLERTSKIADRKKVAKATKIPLGTLTNWAHFCDLLRVNGIGPTMARLLQAAGVLDVAMLRKQSAPVLLKAVTAANVVQRITELLPGEEHLKTWIERATALPLIVE